MMLDSYTRAAVQARALGHPIRIAILGLILGGTDSPAAIGRELREEDPSLTLNHITYHVRTLSRAGIIEAIARRQVRGVHLTRYALTDRGRLLYAALQSP